MHSQSSVFYKLSAITVCVILTVLLYMSTVTQSGTMRELLPSTEAASAINPFRMKIVHFDLKGAPFRVEYFAQVFPMLKALGVHGILMEYEDTFPYWDDLKLLRNEVFYSSAEIEQILMAANNSNLEVIPLVQTFGHLEFLLKHKQFMHLREDSMKLASICPSDAESWDIITKMLKQVHSLHPNSRSIHIGADEARSVGVDKRCSIRLKTVLNSSTERLKLDHITRVAKFALETLKVSEVLAWNDMFENTAVKLLKEYRMGELITPVIWGYNVDVTTPGYFPLGMFQRFASVFPKMLFGSAFKGANGVNQAFINIAHYLSIHMSYLKLYNEQFVHLRGKIDGIIITGWQRFSHFEELCEIFPVGIPSLVVDLLYLHDVSASKSDVIASAQRFLQCARRKQQPTFPNSSAYPYWPEHLFTGCAFPGSKVYDEMEKFRMHNWRMSNGELRDERKMKSYKAVVESIKLNLVEHMTPLFHNKTIGEVLRTQIERAIVTENVVKTS